MEDGHLRTRKTNTPQTDRDCGHSDGLRQYCSTVTMVTIVWTNMQCKLCKINTIRMHKYVTIVTLYSLSYQYMYT